MLVAATGAVRLPEEPEGLTGPGWMEKMFTFYNLEGASALACALAPLSSPSSPTGTSPSAASARTSSSHTSRPSTARSRTPIASKTLGDLLEEKGVALVKEFNTGEVDGPGGRLISYDEREVTFDLLVTVPVHGGAECVTRSPGLGDELNSVPTNMATLQSEVKPTIFVLGDAANIPTSKAGSVTHFEGELCAENVERFLAGEAFDESYDGHANYFVETGFKKALLIDFDYETEPLPGRLPNAMGPMPLLEESRLNHLGKPMFQWFYWNALLEGREIPGISAEMSMSGRYRPE